MAKGDGLSYEPQPYAGTTVEELTAWLTSELDRVGNAFDYLADGRADVKSVVPAKPREGTLAYADGVNWNPGSGAGFYSYTAGAWRATFVTPGTIVDYGGGTVPADYLLCDGSNVSRTTYAALFAAIGTTWGTGDGSTTFGLPDLRRRVTVGKGGSGTSTLGNAVGNTGGEEAHALSSEELASHTHSVSGNTGGISAAHSHNDAAGANWLRYDVPGGAFGGGGAGNAAALNLGGDTVDHSHAFNVTSGSTGSGTAHNNIQPSAVVTKMIKI